MKIALMFPGQGSQSTGMLAQLAEKYGQLRERFALASEVIGQDLWAISQEEDKSYLLNQTAITQPILLASGMGCYDIFRAETGANGDFFAGHSLGEYTALCAAGALDYKKAIDLVHNRGRLMQAAVGPGEGAMAAILGLEDKQVVEVCDEVGKDVSAANFNSPGQVVIAGKTAAVERAIALAKEKGAKRAVLLPVSVPSHCSLMRAASAELSNFLTRINWQKPSAPVVYNVDAKLRPSTESTATLLGAQLYQPVLWSNCIESLKSAGATLFIELGPNKVLTGLNKHIDKSLNTLALDSVEAVTEVKGALGV